MPVVTALIHKDLAAAVNVEKLKKRLEAAYKAAWTSMGDGFKSEDVCACLARNPDRVVLGSPLPVAVFFYYTDRGSELQENLDRALRRAIRTTPGDEDWICILTVPVDSGYWSPDPIWSQAPCHRAHVEGLTPSGYDDGWR